MKNKTILMTGATSGIGFQSALALAKFGGSIVITGRKEEAAIRACELIKAESQNKKVYYLLADLSTIKGMRQLVADFRKDHHTLDILILNAGSAAPAFQKTEDHLELNFAVNVYCPYFLINGFKDLLESSSTARVIAVTGGDLPSDFNFEQWQNPNIFDGLHSYSQSKVAMMAIMHFFSKQNDHVTFNVCYPGHASTHMTQSVTKEMLPTSLRFLFPLFKYLVKDDGGKSAKKASQSTVFLATSDVVRGKSGLYYNAKIKKSSWPLASTDRDKQHQLYELLLSIDHSI